MTPIDSGRWSELCAAFDALVELDADARAERLAALEASDPAFLRSLEQLLVADANADAQLGQLDALFGSARLASAEGAAHVGDVLGLVGRMISHFRVLEPLGSGGMGAVYRAVDVRLNRTVALKLPLPGQQVDTLVRERFLREARAVGALDHPYLCSIHEAGETEDGQLFLAMPLYPGETLKARIAREGRLPVRDALGIAGQIAQGLGAAHRAGIVHRDLKPSNIVLCRDGKLKLVDFGTARVSDMTLTRTRGLLGTAPYMAPEQVRGEPAGARADLWALGVLLYEMLTGRRPFEGEHELAVIHSIMHSVPPRPSRLRPELGPALESLVLGLLEKDPAGRPASAEAVVSELTDLESLSHRKGLRRPVLFRGRARHVGRWAAATAVVLAAGTAAWQLRAQAPVGASHPLTVAVLPFDNLGQTGDDYLSLAIPVEMAARLSRLRTVSVPGQSTTLGYVGTERPLAEIAGELGGAAVVTGSVRHSLDDIRLKVEVFDPRRNRSIMTREWSATGSGLAALEGDVTEAVAGALRLQLRRGERSTLRRRPTASPEAYDLYLRGRSAEMSAEPEEFNYPALQPPAVESLKRAESFFARAREVDPDFADARARLALTQIALAPYDETMARRDQSRIEAETALRLQPGNAEAHEALALYWMLSNDAESAVGELEKAIDARPHVSRLHVLMGRNLRGLGRWQEAVSTLELASRLDPRGRTAHYQAAVTYSRVRRYEEAIEHWDRVIALDGTGDPFPQIIRGYAYLRLGNVDSLDAAIGRIPLAPDAGGMTTYARFNTHRIQERHVEALALLDSARHGISSEELMYRPVSLMRAQTLERLGDAERARASYEAARALLEDSVAAHPQDGRMRVSLGLAYAGLDRREEAMREARAAAGSMPVASSSPTATAYLGGALEVYSRLGEADAAFELIELLLAMPAGREISVPLLRLDPDFDKLRDDPRFEALVGDPSRN
jgi:tetratricopeptide (TPR) repeat protein/TolB-like protein